MDLYTVLAILFFFIKNKGESELQHNQKLLV